MSCCYVWLYKQHNQVLLLPSRCQYLHCGICLGSNESSLIGYCMFSHHWKDKSTPDRRILSCGRTAWDCERYAFSIVRLFCPLCQKICVCLLADQKKTEKIFFHSLWSNQLHFPITAKSRCHTWLWHWWRRWGIAAQQQQTHMFPRWLRRFLWLKPMCLLWVCQAK